MFPPDSSRSSVLSTVLRWFQISMALRSRHDQVEGLGPAGRHRRVAVHAASSEEPGRTVLHRRR